MLALLLLFCGVTSGTDDTYSFLQHYGYIDNKTDVKDIVDLKSALVDFQERYNLPVDGTLNDETKALMAKPRCTVGDNNFMIHSTKWNKAHLKWYFPQGAHANLQEKELYSKLITKAFSFWQNDSNLIFEEIVSPPYNPDITITVTRKTHSNRVNCQGKGNCPYNLDGPGKTLAHSFFPNEQGKCVEIHMDADERWYLGQDGPVPDDQPSFLMVLAHEIGHALGLQHSGVESALMFPWYQQDLHSLDDDDKHAIQYLYGAPKKNRTENKTTTTTTTTSILSTTLKTTVTAKQTPRLPLKNLCDVKQPDFMFLARATDFKNYRLYIASDNYLWKIDINDPKIPEPELLNNYLPPGLSSKSHVFPNSLGDLLVFNKENNRYHSVAFPQLIIQRDYLISSLQHNVLINSAFASNTGQIYVFFNNNSFIEINSEDGDIIDRGLIRDAFPGVALDVTTAFRYIDGNLYFLRQGTYFKYNEFQRKLLEAGPFDWNIFGIPCPDNSLLENLRILLSKVIKIYE